MLVTNINERPDWVPSKENDSFTSYIKKGVTGSHDGMSSQHCENKKFIRKTEKHVKDYVDGVLNKDRTMLAQAITLIESNAQRHVDKAQAVLNELLPHVGSSIRIGITGVPGAGKSTFIESFGTYLCDKGYHVAVLAVDPSSSITGGSILGDKTRMENLSRHPRAFVRPSPSGGTLGGVHRKTRETMLLCEAAGFDVILVETVGVGQSEIVVRTMVDFFLLLALTGAGDELQGMKKGVLELADALIINKADGDNKRHAEIAQRDYNRFLHYLRPATEGWETKAYTCSALLGTGIDNVWKIINEFVDQTKAAGTFESRRKAQMKEWIHATIKDQLETRFFTHPQIKGRLPQVESNVISGNIPVTLAVQQLLALYFNEN
ncbi:methylmalonyl Co-A mutase-associated GTPase MeaB [Cytobacillus sp. IB215665]|uniref:methylmalonyl Co-A mutase-associated GTPase MeaB n=1 Tax=Cytobacillus sp. IB215665 TaxID=3097357 RepID=UPI002A0F5DB1|nr:methylmalonyl Co-A mutase-associated GTPase MeaB [Cytobacillus sp. IB215665]MDX8364311.1 methylmalonyl Co-A mutase-associated GTPase MeaB [Cytobacillus sp. IB215665]